MIECSIIGQSNSILRDGFADLLFSDHPVRLAKSGRLGGSSSVLLPLFGDEAFFRAARFCIIDCCIIDFAAVSDRSLGFLDVLQSLEWVCVQSRHNECEPIFVIIPTEYYIARDNIFYQSITGLFRRMRCYYVDVRDTAFLHKDDLPTKLYDDGSHLGMELSALVAETLYEFMARYDALPGIRISTSFPLRQFRVVNLQQVLSGHEHQVSRKTSLYDFHGVALYPEHPIKIEIGPFHRLHGVVVNAAQCRSVVSFNHYTLKNLNIRSYADTDYEARAISLQSSISSLDGCLEIATEHSGSPAEHTLHSVNEIFTGDSRVEMSDLILETGWQSIELNCVVPTEAACNISGLLHDYSDIV